MHSLPTSIVTYMAYTLQHVNMQACVAYLWPWSLEEEAVTSAEVHGSLQSPCIGMHCPQLLAKQLCNSAYLQGFYLHDQMHQLRLSPELGPLHPSERIKYQLLRLLILHNNSTLKWADSRKH